MNKSKLIYRVHDITGGLPIGNKLVAEEIKGYLEIDNEKEVVSIEHIEEQDRETIIEKLKQKDIRIVNRI